jgi:hypothetical protein
MNNNKNNIVFFSILTIIISLFIIFNQPKKDINQSPLNSSVSSSSSTISFKDNKVIELEPVLKENWDYKEKSFTPVAEGVAGYPTKGISGTREYSFPLGSNNPQYKLNIFNTNLPITSDNQVYATKFINAVKDLRSVNNFNNSQKAEDFSELRIPFTDLTDNQLAAKFLKKDVTFVKPDRIQEFKVFLTKDGNGGILEPVLNIIGKVGNDYFLLTNYLRDINIKALTDQAKTNCGTDSDCITKKLETLIDAQLTTEFIDSNIKSMLQVLK